MEQSSPPRLSAAAALMLLTLARQRGVSPEGLMSELILAEALREHGMEPESPERRAGDKAARAEALAGQRASFVALRETAMGAKSWDDLSARGAALGYRLEGRDADFTVQDLRGHALCKAARIGIDYDTLMLRLGPRSHGELPGAEPSRKTA